MKKVVLLGSTGSIGTSTCKVVADLPDRIQLIGLAAGGNAELLAEQIRQFKPTAVSITDPAKAAQLRQQLGKGVEVLSGDAGLLQLATMPENVGTAAIVAPVAYASTLAQVIPTRSPVKLPGPQLTASKAQSLEDF